MTYYELFCVSFPELDVSKAAFDAMMPLQNKAVLEYRVNGELVGYAVVDKNALQLLCVRPDCRGWGIGASLLRHAEEKSRRAGEKQMVIGGGSRMFIGAPEGSKGFFEKQGYAITEHYDEMSGDLKAFRAADFSLPVPDGVTFGWYHGPWDALEKAVAAVDETWVQYFGKDQPIFCAMAGNEIASFCIAEEWENGLLSNGHNKVGAPGCVGTVPKFRRQGIGLKMVALACEELKKQGCDTCFIHYTGVGHWYAKLGFRVFLTQYFCHKDLK